MTPRSDSDPPANFPRRHAASPRDVARAGARRSRPPRGVPRAPWARLTVFQRLVYRATAEIPRGQTRPYRWVAERIGRPNAVRAVGNALHRNPFAPRVPCHRVIRSDGSLGGFARGPAKKRRLLQQEGMAPQRRPHTRRGRTPSS